MACLLVSRLAVGGLAGFCTNSRRHPWPEFFSAGATFAPCEGFDNGAMQISQLAAATGLSVHRLRRYADAGLLLSTRGPGGFRRFDAQAVRDARFIAMARDIGFALAELANLLPRYRARTLTIEEMVERLQTRIAVVDAAIAEQQALRARLVEHVGWFEARRRQAARNPSRRRNSP